MVYLSDEAKVDLKLVAADTLRSLRGHMATIEERVEVHEECGGTGGEYGHPDGPPCVYCRGSGRIVTITARVTAPYIDSRKE